MKWGLWSQTAASNSNTPPDGWPEGQAPSTVNDCAREMMAQIATGLQDLQFIDLGLSPTQTGNTTFTVPGNQASILHYGRRIKALDGANTIYGTIISASQTTNTGVTLRLDTGNGPFLDASLSAFAVGFPSQVNTALPENAVRDANYFDNPYFDVWQRGNGPFSFSSTAAINYSADRWGFLMGIASAGCTMAITRGELSANASNVPTLAQAGVFLGSSLVISCNAALTGLSATDSMSLRQVVEGYRYRNLAGKPITISFWVNSTLTGTYCVSITNSGSDRSIVLEYSISSASTWEKKTLTFPKPPTAGTWDYSSGIGLNVRFALVTGSNGQGGAGNWTAGNVLATSNQVNFASGTGRSFKFTAPKIQEGTQATPLQPTDFQAELFKCQHVLRVITGTVGGDRMYGWVTATNVGLVNYPLSPNMRTNVPSISVVGGLSGLFITSGNGAFLSVSAVAAANSSRGQINVLVSPVGTPLTFGQGTSFGTSAGTAQIVIKNEF